HDDFCDTPTAVGTGSLSPTPICYANTAHPAGVVQGSLVSGIAQDSNDDGVPDYLVASDPFNLADNNSDSDRDGRSDYSEVSQTALNSACGSSFGVATGANPGLECGVTAGVQIATCLNPKKSNTNGGNECGNGPPLTGTVNSITGSGVTVTYASNTMT